MITAVCPWFAETLPDLSPLPPLGGLGWVGVLPPPPPQPLIVMLTPASMARTDWTVNSRRSRPNSVDVSFA